MEQIKLFISLAFRKEGLASQYPDCIFDFSAKEINEYINALKKEITAASNGCENCQVIEIELGNGSYAHYSSIYIEEIIEHVKQCFHVAKDVHVTLHSSCANFTFYSATIARQLNHATIIIDVPSFNENILHDYNYHTSVQTMKEALQIGFDQQLRDFIVEIDPSIDFVSCLEQLATTTKVKKITFTHELNEKEKVLFEPYKDCFEVHTFKESNDQIGVGLGAISIMQDVKYKNTNDLAFYLENAEDFEKIASKL